jgi:hypothetical protein
MSRSGTIGTKAVDHQRDPPGGLPQSDLSIRIDFWRRSASSVRKFIDFRITAFTALTARTREFRQSDTNFGPRHAVNAVNALN